MSKSSDDLKINVTADVKQAAASLKSIDTAVSQMAAKRTGVESLVASVAKFSVAGVTAAAMVHKLWAEGKECVEAYAKLETVQTSLIQKMRNAGDSVGYTAGELLDLADAFSSTTTYSTATVTGVESVLAATRGLSKDGLKQAISDTLDLAAAMGTDAAGEAKKLAQVLTDPIANLDSLKDSNIQFTDSEKAQIKTLQEGNSLREAQTLVLKKVEATYGGVAKEIASTDSGKITQIKNLMDDIHEGLGQGIITSLFPAFSWLEKKLKETKKRIDDINATTQLKHDLESGVNISEKYSSDVIFEQMQKAQAATDSAEEILRVAYAGHYGIKPENAGNFSKQPEIFWANLNGGTYLQTYRNWQENKGLASRYGQAYLTAKTNEDAVPNFESSGFTNTGMSSIPSASPTYTTDSFIETNKTLSVSKQVLDIDKQIEVANHFRFDAAAKGNTKELTQLNEIVSGLQKQKKALTETPAKAATDEVSAFISANKSLTVTGQQIDLTKQLKTAEDLRTKAYREGNTQAVTQLDEIIGSLQKEKNSLSGVKSAATTVKSAYEEMQTYLPSVESLFSSTADFVNQLYQNRIDSLEDMLSECETKWDDYFDDLDEKQESQKSSLAHMYAEGLISAEDYDKAIEDLADARSDAKEQEEAEEESLTKKKNELAKKQFELGKANSLATITMNGAMAIAQIWSQYAANPVAAKILTGLSAAAILAQYSTVAAQQYTGLAAGGIVDKPTIALIGEAGKREAVQPLPNDLDLSNPGKDSGLPEQVVININGDIYDADAFFARVHDGIEQGQRTGKITKWRYVNG